ncbi:MAG: hypothetical protein HY671_11185 [Chloroflexi bacterium]|nr:hypothetical protein [Chloroflexota bacterium]
MALAQKDTKDVDAYIAAVEAAEAALKAAQPPKGETPAPETPAPTTDGPNAVEQAEKLTEREPVAA